MSDQWTSFGIGVLAGMRTMTAAAALTWAGALGRARVAWIPASGRARAIATASAFAEMAGDKMPFAPDRRIAPSFLARLAIGAVGGAAFAGRDAPLLQGVLSGMAGATVGTLLGRAARGGTTRSRADWTRALTEDALAVGLAAALVGLADRRASTVARIDAPRRHALMLPT